MKSYLYSYHCTLCSTGTMQCLGGGGNIVRWPCLYNFIPVHCGLLLLYCQSYCSIIRDKVSWICMCECVDAWRVTANEVERIGNLVHVGNNL